MRDDEQVVNCADCREAVSAALDGEDHPVERTSIDTHIGRCASCREFVDRAALITRFARTGVARPGPDLVDAVLAAAPPVGRPRRTDVLRALLAMVGVGQLALAVNGVLAARTGDGHHADGLGGASLAHFAHESSAWNLALATGFLYAAWRTARSAGLVPVLASFVGVLGVLSLLDLAAGRVDPERLVSHGLVVAGLVLMVALTRLGRRHDGGTPDTVRGGNRPAVRGPVPTAPEGSPSGDGGHRGLKPTARRDVA